MRKLLTLFLLAVPLFAQQQVQPVAGVLTLNLVPGTSSFKVILSASVTSVVIVNPTPGTIISVIFTENATGGFTVAFGGNISSSSCNVNTAANATTTCQFQYDSTSNSWNGIGTVGTLPNSPLPSATSGPGPVFNVKNYGAKGDAQQSPNGNGTAPGLTCTDCNFTSADVGKNVACANAGSTVAINTHTIASVVNSTSVTINPSSREGNGPCTITWGTLDDAAVASAKTAFLAAILSKAQGGNLGVMSAAPVLYFPTAGYFLNNGIRIITASAQSGGKIQGDGKDLSKLYFTTGGTGVNAMLDVSANQSNFYVNDLTLDGMQGVFTTGSNFAFAIGGSNVFLNNIIVQNFGNIGGIQAAGPFLVGYNVVSAGNALTLSGTISGFICQGCSGVMHSGGFSNNGNAANVVIQGVGGSTGGPGFTMYDGLVDECGTNTTGCTQVINSHDVWFVAARLFGTPTGHCISIDANSFVHWTGGLCGAFGVDNNVGGPTIAAGGGLQASDLRSISTGTGKCITNSGLFNDNGGNSCESAFAIASGTSTGTAAVLTVTTLGANANTNCAVGDSLLVESAGIAGYNGYFKAGITAVTATTISYTTQGSNLGALGAGGDAHCRNLLTYSGTLPVALLNNPIPNTCYVTITPITNATTFNLCNWGAGTATNITRITGSSQVVTTCATAPIITISNGTVSQTLTLTSAKQFWDSFSAQDASTGVGSTIFKPSISATGTDRITIKYDAGALSSCATPPTNLAISYTIAPILSN